MLRKQETIRKLGACGQHVIAERGRQGVAEKRQTVKPDTFRRFRWLGGPTWAVNFTLVGRPIPTARI